MFHKSHFVNILTSATFIILIFGLGGCTKDFLSVKRDKSESTLYSVSQLQGLMDNTQRMNASWPEAGLIGADNMYILYEDWLSTSSGARDNYIWGDDVFMAGGVNDWSLPYIAIFYANLVLDGVNDIAIDASQTSDLDNVRGQAYFFRAYGFYQLAQLFAKPYNENTSKTDPGVPLRLTSDLNAPTVRSTVQETYDQIIKDLSTSLDLLPVKPLYKTRPSKPAALAMLARTYLVMGDYGNALEDAEKSFQLYDSLMDYNTIDPSPTYPFQFFNAETIFFTRMAGTTSCQYPPKAKVDSGLYKMYQSNDLRKRLFFKPIDSASQGFYGNYSGESDQFTGIATDEVLLMAAECNARVGNKDKAMQELNLLLKSRYKYGTFVPLQADNQNQALDIVLSERRKELAFRGLRWTDLRRINNDPIRAVTITRILNGEHYVLKPNDPRYVFPIPEDVIQMTGIAQNER